MSETPFPYEDLISTLISIWTIICLWKIFVKAGEAGWKAIIPVWDTYVICKIVKRPSRFWLVFSLPIIGLIWIIGSLVFYLIMVSGSEIQMMTLNIFNWILGISSFVFIIVTLVFIILLQVRLGRAFGKGGWFCFGMVILPFIFWGIIAFDSSKYVFASNDTDSNDLDSTPDDEDIVIVRKTEPKKVAAKKPASSKSSSIKKTSTSKTSVSKKASK